jgi:hypothetical protein
MRCRKPFDPKRKYILLSAFAIGLLVACYCPPKFLIAVLAAAVIVLGITGAKC